MRKISVSIVGSCLWRDIFNSRFVENYSDYFCVDSYFARTSVVSIMEKAIPYDISKFEKQFEPLHFEYHYTECAKQMLTILENNQSDLLLLDFYGELFYGMYAYDDTYIRGWATKGALAYSGLIEQKKITKFFDCQNFASDYLEIWKNYMDMFVSYAREHFPNTTIVINGIKATDIITKDRKIIGRQQTPVGKLGALNHLWKKMDDYCRNVHGLHVIEYDKAYTLNPDYIYNLGNELVHFHGDYYQDAFTKLIEFCNENSISLKSVNKKATVNMLRNGEFAEGTKFWTYKNAEWQIDKINEKNWISLKGASKKMWSWIWCDPIEVVGNGKDVYTLTSTIMLKEEISEKSVAILAFRTFKNAILKDYKDCSSSGMIEISLVGKEIGKEYEINYDFVPDAKFVRIAVHQDYKLENKVFITSIQLKRK